MSARAGRPPKYHTDAERLAARRERNRRAQARWQSKPANRRKQNAWRKLRRAALKQAALPAAVP